jgi:hypothetical protein
MTPIDLHRCVRAIAAAALFTAFAAAQDPAQPDAQPAQVPAVEAAAANADVTPAAAAKADVMPAGAATAQDTQAPASAPAESPAEPSDELRLAARGRAPKPLVYPPATAEQRSSWGLLLEGALLDSDNGKDFRETGGYYKLLSTLQVYTPQEIHERATRYLDWFAVMQDPNAWRGEFVRRRGVFTGARAVRLDRPVAGITDVWRCGISDGDATEGVIFDLLTPPEMSIEARVDAIEIEGIFYRTVRYMSEDGEAVEAPYLLVKNIREIPSGQQRAKGLFDGVALYVFCAALLFLGFRLVSVFRQQSRRGYNSRREPSLHEPIAQRAAQHRRASTAPPRNPPPS